MFENRLKSLILHCERSELRLHFEWTKVHQNCPKYSIWRFKKIKLEVKQCYQTGHFYTTKMVKNAKIEKKIATFWVIFKHCALVGWVRWYIPGLDQHCYTKNYFRQFHFDGRKETDVFVMLLNTGMCDSRDSRCIFVDMVAYETASTGRLLLSLHKCSFRLQNISAE